ncbi:MAG TPA: hypothetical protein VH497_05695 [Vicinamibacterales bacterium]|jgi:hypothetical protein
MHSTRIRWLCSCALALCASQLGAAAAQQPPDPTAQPRDAAQPAQAPTQPRPLNPTQEVAGQQPEGNAIEVGPAKLRLGGWVGLTALHRSTNGGGGTGTAFASIPYPDTLQGNVSETRLTAESSRLSIRIDADFPEARFRSLAGYFEMDFSGAAQNNAEVTTGGVGLRMRHAFAEVRYGESFYMSAGQAFSLMTPAKDQLSMWPSDMDLSQAVDTNYVAGLLWGRYPQLRLTWRPSRTFNWAVSVENPEQQIGQGVVALPSCCVGDIDAQFNIGSNQTSVPNPVPDIAARVALNPNAKVHVGAGGVIRVFRNSVAPYTDSFRQLGGGASIDAAVRATKTTRVLLQSGFGPGLGRYIGGLVPDVVFHADGSISPVFAASWVTGVEQKVTERTSLAGYYSGVATRSNYAQDVGGSYIGFGYPGGPNSNNRRIQELTGTFSTLTVATENRGSAQVGVQVSWLEREPWSQGSGPPSANTFMFFVQVRYNLP